jgi:hypothetical protein
VSSCLDGMVPGTPKVCSSWRLTACAAGGSCRGPELACGGRGLWFLAKERAEVPAMRGAVRLSAPVADHAAQVRFVPGRD